MKIFDYVIVGAGAAGCVLANRLSEDPALRVALVEAGPPDRHPLIRMPKGLVKVMADQRHLWVHPSGSEGPEARQPEFWIRGRVLGGSTSINGMMYVRGQPADFDTIAEVSSEDWNWDRISESYRAMENHALGRNADRGSDGPLKITMPSFRNPLTEAQIAAGEVMGWPRKEDINAPDGDAGIGYTPRTIWRGKRQSAATAFLDPVRQRPNLHILTGLTVSRVLFDGKRAIGVNAVGQGAADTILADREVILCGGALASPGILERSGIGDQTRLANLGISLIHHSAQVGENLSEHRGLILQWALSAQCSQNREYSGWRLIRSAIRYYLTGDGPMTTAAYEVCGWFKSRVEESRPDVQITLAPISYDFAKQRQTTERFPGMNAVIYPLRPTSRGSVHITTTDPNVAASFRPNTAETPEDRAAMISAVRITREYVTQRPLQGFVKAETVPGKAYETDDQILAAYEKFGTPAYHAVGSCRMGKDDASVVDPCLRVRGVDGLRVMDTSVMPSIPAGNTQGPTMAMAWRAADIILRNAPTTAIGQP